MKNMQVKRWETQKHKSWAGVVNINIRKPRVLNKQYDEG